MLGGGTGLFPNTKKFAEQQCWNCWAIILQGGSSISDIGPTIPMMDLVQYLQKQSDRLMNILSKPSPSWTNWY